VGRWGDFEKQIPASVCRKKRIACSTNGIKKFLECCKKRKKMLQSYFIIQRAFNKIPAKLQPVFPCSLLNSGFGNAAELLLHISNVLQSSTYQEISVVFG